MITYKSTRGDKTSYTFSEAILQGMATDEGLLVPEKIPSVTLAQLAKLQDKSYQEIALEIFKLFETDFTENVLKNLIDRAYGNQFDSSDITPVVELKNKQYFLELWHGPTSAFKDMALQMMPLLFAEARKIHAPDTKYLILAATSGDTGKAALEGFKDIPGISVVVLYPKGKVSQIQELQMQTQEGNNVHVLALQGDFDDCQKMVKEIFADEHFRKKLLTEKSLQLSSANSINWGRLIPQIVYYFSGYLQLVKQKAFHFGDAFDVVVPSGNFGNSLAGFYAKLMGLPIGKIICASNENNVLTKFIKTGVYDIRDRHIVQTPSPAIDILIANNIERLLYTITHDTQKVATWMRELTENRIFQIDGKTHALLQETFASGWVDATTCLHQIRQIFDQTGYIMDTHTAVAQKVAESYATDKPLLIFSTAHFAKFATDVYAGLTGKRGEENEFLLLDHISEMAPKHVTIPPKITELATKKRLHTKESVVSKKIVEQIIQIS